MIAAWLGRMGLSWVLGPAGKAIGIALVILAAVTYIQQSALARCEAAHAAAELELAEERAVAAERLAQEARERADEAEVKADSILEITDELIEDAGDACPISDDFRERLRAIQ